MCIRDRAIASENNKELDARVMFRRREVLSDELGATSCYDVIVSNPPYITEAEKQDKMCIRDSDGLRFHTNGRYH